MDDKKGPDNTSSDYNAMAPYWTMASTMLAGAAAMRAAGKMYLPKFTNESDADYKIRLNNAKFTNIFGDIVETLAAKPFSKELQVNNGGAEIEALIENIDGQGNHIHQFAAATFYAGLSHAIDWIFVDYAESTVPLPNLDAEKKAGVRPYWVHIPAQSLLAVYTEVIQGKETIVHARVKEVTVERVDFDEQEIERVRVMDRVVTTDATGNKVAGPATWTLYREVKKTAQKSEWVEEKNGIYSIGVIPLVPFIAGRRQGSTWCIKPVLQDAAYLQIEHYQQESGLKHIKELTAFPMLAGNGVTPPMGEDGKVLSVPVGPKTVLFAPPNGDGQHGEWAIMEPQGSSLTFLASEVENTEKQLRELGRQPLTAQSGNITTVTAAFAGDKAHTVIEALALNIKDALENALVLTALWLKQTVQPEIEISTDFGLDLMADNGVTTLDAARARGDLSQKTYWNELKRRSILSPNFNPDDELTAIADEQPADITPAEQAMIDAQQGRQQAA